MTNERVIERFHQSKYFIKTDFIFVKNIFCQEFRLFAPSVHAACMSF